MSAQRDQMLSHYRLIEKIGAGGMGVVWKAADTVLDRTVAIKVLPSDCTADQERRRMFLREAKLAASVADAHIVQVYELGREADLDFIVMEYVAGRPLSVILAAGALTSDRVVSLGLQAAEGLARAHRKRLIHRDLKPGNILVTPDGDVKIVDFGLATLFRSPDSAVGSLASTVSQLAEKSSTIAGTVPYMSPEQLRGEELDARSDIFSFGAVLYEMTTGRRPFVGPTAAAIADSIQNGRPTPVHELQPQVPVDLHRIIDKALACRRDERYQHMDDVVVDLKRLSKALDSGESISFADSQPRRRLQHHSRRRLALAVVACLGVGASGWFAWTRRHEPEIAATDAVDLSKPPQPPNWVLVSEFDGPRDRPDLAPAVRELTLAALEQSTVVTPIPRAELQRGLALAMKQDSTHVRGSVARELAFRAAARTYIEGRIDRILSGYSIVLRVFATDDDHLVASISRVAANDEAVIAVVDQISRELREKLGEKATAVRATRSAQDLITPSFAAYRKLVEAGDLAYKQFDIEAAKQAYRGALVLDPNCAAAWMGLAFLYGNQGLADSARTAREAALRRPERLGEVQRLMLEASRQDDNCDPEAALRAYDVLARINPAYRWHPNRASLLGELGRVEEATQVLSQAAIQWGAFGPPPTSLIPLAQSLLRLGRLDEARALVDSLPFVGVFKPYLQMSLAAIDANWSRVESLATAVRTNPRSNAPTRAGRRMRFSANRVLVALAAQKGRIHAANRDCEALLLTAVDANDAGQLNFYRLFMLGVAGQTPRDAATFGDSTTDGLVLRGLQFAVCGDTTSAARLLERIRSANCPLDANDANVLEGMIAAAAGRWSDALRLLQPETGLGVGLWSGRLPVRWIVSQAEEQLGDLQAAAHACEEVLVVRGTDPDELRVTRLMLFPFVHLRLARLYSGLDHRKDAERHRRIAEQTFTDPDPEIRLMIESARRRLAGSAAQP